MGWGRALALALSRAAEEPGRWVAAVMLDGQTIRAD